MGPGQHSLSLDQAMDAALQLHKDVCLMTTNFDILDQYVLCLQSTASNILELGLGPRGFPSEEVAAGPMDAALQLHKDVCLMTTNFDILDQYVVCLQSTASNILELGLGPRGFPSEEVAAGPMGPRVRQMEAIGLWRPSLIP